MKRQPPVFILGAPRSGSTLLMQVLIRLWDVSYLTNMHKFCFGHPSLAEVYLDTTATSRLDFRSKLGETSAFVGPWEGGDWWYRFFPRWPHYATDSLRSAVDVDGLEKSVAVWTSRAGRSLLFKNLYASLRLRYITEVFPNAHFIHITRNERDQAISILRAREMIYGSYSRWWSMKPPGWQSVEKSDPVSQVLFQIRKTNETVVADLAKFGVSTSKVSRLRYEELCSHPRETGQTLQEFSAGIGISAQESKGLPSQFKRSSEARIHSDLLERLNQVTDTSPGAAGE